MCVQFTSLSVSWDGSLMAEDTKLVDMQMMGIKMLGDGGRAVPGFCSQLVLARLGGKKTVPRGCK